MKITLPCIFGLKSKDKLIGETGSIVLTLDEMFLITRTQYRYETLVIEDDELSGYKLQTTNEKSYLKKSSIEQIGVGYDNEMEVYFIAITYGSKNSFINVESAEKGNELLNQLIEWWKS